MKDLFREFDFTKVGFYKSILESQGIETFVKNRDVSGLAGEASILPELWPTLCVVHDEDYDRAMAAIRERLVDINAPEQSDKTCVACGEVNPVNFEIGWSCGADLVPV